MKRRRRSPVLVAAPGSSDASIGNDEFFGGPPLDERGYPIPAWRRAYVPEKAFFPTKRPPEERSFAEIGARHTLRFGALLLGLGWLGILIQRGLLRQLVVGAPVFEEFAKFGLALVAVSLLRVRPVWARVPFGWASGAAFGVFEHFVSYADEDLATFVLRVLFHGGSCGLAITLFTMLEPGPDVRLRWASTLPSSLFHWAFNFGSTAMGLVLAIAGVPDGTIGALSIAWGGVIAAAIFVSTAIILTRPEAAHRRALREAGRLLAARPGLTGADLPTQVAPEAATAAAEPSGGPQEPSPRDIDSPESPARPPAEEPRRPPGP